MTRLRPIAFTAAMSLCLASCATVTHRPVSKEIDKTDLGIRYLRSSPYLIAYSDGKGGLVTEIQYLPDPNKKMSATPEAVLSNVGATLEFDRGVLSSSSEKADATAVPTAIAKAVEGVAGKLLEALANVAEVEPHRVPAPYVFKIVVVGDEVHFLGGPGDTPIQITLRPAKED